MTDDVGPEARSLGASGLLQAAAQLVARAVAQLDVTKTECAQCGMPKFRRRTHARVAEKLARTADMLTSCAARLADDD